jgi:hypothetical protein
VATFWQLPKSYYIQWALTYPLNIA